MNQARGSYFNISLKSFKSPTICFVFQLTLCQIGSNCCLTIISKFLCNALSTFQSSTSSSFKFPFLISLSDVSIHWRIEVCICCIDSVMAIFNSITSAFLISNDSATERWKRGQSVGVLRWRFLIMVAKGAKPVVNGSGLSENALMNPSLFFWRYKRRMKASGDAAVTLHLAPSAWWLWSPIRTGSYFSACSTTTPVIFSGERTLNLSAVRNLCLSVCITYAPSTNPLAISSK